MIRAMVLSPTTKNPSTQAMPRIGTSTKEAWRRVLGGEGGGSGLCRNGLAIVSYQINILSWEPFLAERIIMVVTTTMMTMLICVRCVKVWGVLDVWGCEGCDPYGNDCNDWSMEGPVGTILISYPTAACEEEDTVNNSALRYWLQATGYCYMHYSYLAM